MKDKLSVLKRTSKIKECFRKDSETCFGKIVQSHSLQKNGKLTFIEQEYNGNKCIFTPTECIFDEYNHHTDLTPIGKTKASTFSGFCSYHDKKIFSPIEDFDFTNDCQEQLFLHSYRAFAHSYHIQRQMLRAYLTNSKFTENMNPYFRKDMIEGYIDGVKEGNEMKLYLNNCLTDKKYDSLSYFSYILEDKYPIASSGVISLNYSIFGQPINNHDDPNIPYTDIMFTLFPDKIGTLIIIATKNNNTKGLNLLEELSHLTHEQLLQIISTFLTFYSENTFFSPSLWTKMTESEKKQYLKELDYAISDMFISAPSFQLARTNFFQKKFIIK